VRRRVLTRGITPELLQRWEQQSERHRALLNALGVHQDTVTTDLVLRPVPTKSPGHLARELSDRTDELLQVFTLIAGERRFGLAMTFAKTPTARTAPLVIYVEIHSRLVAWWLTYAWRSWQLADAAASLADADQTVPAATCARALFETAAAFWADAHRLADIWAEAKANGTPSFEQESLATRQRFVTEINEVQFGGKFSDRVPETQAVFGKHPRRNVVGAIAKLAKAYPGDVQDDYEWLCNTAHPSLGTALVFSGPPLLHATGMQLQRWFAGVPLVIESPAHFDDRQFVERSIPSATARATVAALDVLTTTLDASLQMIDDIGLTTGAPAFADFPYWRSLAPAERNAPCVCRSGRKTKQCHHAWSDPAPAIPETFGSCTG
jgi:hypothetical protein